MSYIIETRTPETDERPAGPWHSDGMGPDAIEVESVEEGDRIIGELRQVGPDWAEAEYRVVPRVRAFRGRSMNHE